MKAPLYAAALFRSLSEAHPREHDRLIEHFVMLVRARGHERLMPAIIREYEKRAARHAQTEQVELTLARAEDRERLQEHIARDLQLLETAEEPRTVVDERIVGGYGVRARGTRIDRTHRRALLDLYQRLVNNM